MSNYGSWVNQSGVEEEIPPDLYSFLSDSSLQEQQQAFLLAQQQDQQRRRRQQEQKLPPDRHEIPELVQASDDEVMQQHLIAQEIALQQIQRGRGTVVASDALPKPPPPTTHVSAFSAIVPQDVYTSQDYCGKSDYPMTQNTHFQQEDHHRFEALHGAAPASSDNSKAGQEEATGAGDSTTTATTAVATDDDEEQEAVRLAEQRVARGQCPSCGEQLYKLTKSKDRRGSVTKILNKLWGSSSSMDATVPSNGSNGTGAEEAPRSKAAAAAAAAPEEEYTVRKKPLHVPGVVHRGQCVKCSKVDDGQAATSSDQEEDEEDANVFLQDDGFQEDEYLQNSILNPLLVDTSSDPSGNQVQDDSDKTPATVTMATYEGPLNVYGQRHGLGTLKWSNGDVYSGNFVNGVRQGAGKLTFGKNGAGGEYVGDWKSNLMHGTGSRRFPNGDLYTGPYVQGKRQGAQGRFYFSNGDLYVGGWKDDAMDGFGRYYYHHGQRFEGDFVQGLRQGKGKLQRLDGSLDIYRYVRNTRTGTGVRWSADRQSAWKLLDSNNASGRSFFKTKKIPIAEAVSVVYEIENAVESLTPNAHYSDCPNIPQGTTV